MLNEVGNDHTSEMEALLHCRLISIALYLQEFML